MSEPRIDATGALPVQQPRAEIRSPGKLLPAALALVAALVLQGDGHSPADGPQYSTVAAASSGESPVCTAETAQGPVISFDCLKGSFPHSLPSAARNIVRATVTVNLHYPQQFGGDIDSGATATMVSPTEAITAGHLLPTNPTEEYRTTQGDIWLGNACGQASDIEGDQVYLGKRGFRARLRWLWDSFFDDVNRADTRNDLSQLEVASNPDVAVVKFEPNDVTRSLPTVSFATNPGQILRTGDELLISSDQWDRNTDMRGEVGSPARLAQPDVIDAIYLATNRLDPSTFFVLTGIGSETQQPGEPTATAAGASGATVMLMNGSKGVGLLVGGKDDDDGMPVPVNGSTILKDTGVRVVDPQGRLVKHAYLELVQAVPSAGQMASAAIRGCDS